MSFYDLHLVKIQEGWCIQKHHPSWIFFVEIWLLAQRHRKISVAVEQRKHELKRSFTFHNHAEDGRRLSGYKNRA